VSNAIHFTHPGGNVELGMAQSDDAHVRIWVRDNGIGIPLTEVANLFEKYRQCSNATESGQKGTGLGLVICKMVVQAHGGRIWVETEEGKGSIFFFSLPIPE
jgi:signal transduction histidine kinase